MSKAVTVRFAPGGIERIQLHVTDKKNKLTASQVRKRTGADVVINASLYDANRWGPNCDVKAAGKVLNDDKYSYRGLGWNSGEGSFHVVTSGEMRSYDNFLSCVLLIWNGVAYPYHADAAVSRKSGRTVLLGLKDGSALLPGRKFEQDPQGAPDGAPWGVPHGGLGSDAGWRRECAALAGGGRVHLLHPPGA